MARPYVPMALTLFPTEICLKFASVPGPEAHKYVIPPISCGSVAPLPIFSSSSPSPLPAVEPPPLSSSLLVTLATPYMFLRGCSSRRCTRGNAVNHLSRKKTQCNIPVVLLETPSPASSLLLSPLFAADISSFFLSLLPSISHSIFRGNCESHKSALILPKIL